MKKFFKFAVCIALLLCFSFAFGGCNNNDGLSYSCTENSSAVFSGTECKEKNLTVPDKYDGKPVIGISEYAFVRNGNIESITMPEGITYIGAGAFYMCNGLTAINLPSTVVKIDYIAFEYCIKLNTINYGGTKEQWYAVEKFYQWDANTGEYIIKCTDGDITKSNNGNNLGTSGLGYSIDIINFTCILKSGLSADSADVTVPEKYYNFTVSEIGDKAFSSGQIESVRISEGVSKIGYEAFDRCDKLKTVYLPSTIVELCYNSFNGCTALTDIYFNGTRKSWNNVQKENAWDINTFNCTIHCSDDNQNKA